jgi:5-methylcytosine-specific restriction endonuclease McrA
LELLRTCSKCKKAKPETGAFFGHTPSGNFRYECKDCENARSREYNKRNPESRRRRDERREQKGGRVSWPLETKHLLRTRQHGICPCCAKPLESAALCQVDHIKPVNKGGTNDLANLAAVHSRCNQDKHGKELFDHWAWRVKVGYDDANLGVELGIATEMMKRDVWTPEIFLEVILGPVFS